MPDRRDEPAQSEPVATVPDEAPAAPDRRSGWGRPPLAFLALILLAGVVGWWIGRSDRDSFNDVDVGFLADMTVHHEGAISLGFDYLRNEHDNLVGHFAREIVFLQAQQIATMNSLLEDAGDPERASDDVAMDWMGSPVTSARMPGLATETEFAELRGAQGLAADDVFTRLMIRHHAAGAAMAEYAAEHGSNTKVRELASSMATVQRLEITELQHRRAELGLPAVDTTDVELHTTHR
jgi:uncharacterized protein (DUF305 family)